MSPAAACHGPNAATCVSLMPVFVGSAQGVMLVVGSGEFRTFEEHGFPVTSVIISELICLLCLYCGPEWLSCIAAHYWLDCTGIESQWGVRFTAPAQTGPRVHPAYLYNGYWVFPEGKAARVWRCVGHSPPSSAEVKERIELYIYSPSEPLW